MARSSPPSTAPHSRPLEKILPGKLRVIDGSTVDAEGMSDAVCILDLHALSERRDSSFVCPACHGCHFGRDVVDDGAGGVKVLDTVRCHDQHRVRCTWRGLWTKPRFLR